MKKKFVLFLACFALFVLSFGLVACGQQQPNYYNITVDENIQNGSVEVGVDKAKNSEIVYIRVSADAGYGVVEVSFNGQVIEIDATGHGQFVMPGRAVVVRAKFGELKTINTTAEHGYITIASHNENKAAIGSTVKGTVTATQGYALNTLSRDEQYLQVSLSGEFSFVMPNQDVNLVAEFLKLYNVSVVSSEQGDVNLKLESGLSGKDIEVLPGTKVRVVATPNEGYVLNEVKYSYSDQTITLSDPYSFEMPEADVKVFATFKDFEYSVDGLYICTKVNSSMPEEYYKNNFLYFNEGNLDLGIVSGYEYFVGKGFTYSLNKDEIQVNLGDVESDVVHSQKVLKNGNVEVKIQFESMQETVYTFEKYSGENVVLQAGTYSTNMSSDNFQTVLESDGNILIVESGAEKGRDYGRASFYGNLMIIESYEGDDQIVGRLRKTQENSYLIDASDYWYVSGYNDGQDYHEGYLEIQKSPINITRVGDFDETEKVYVIKSKSGSELADYEKQMFVAFKGNLVTIGVYMNIEGIFQGFYYRQYVPYTKGQDGKITVTLNFDGVEDTFPIEATIVENQLTFNFEEEQFVFELDTNPQLIENGLNYNLQGYSPEDGKNWIFVYNDRERNIEIFYKENGETIYGEYRYYKVSVYADKFVCFNKYVSGNIVVGTISGDSGTIHFQGYEYQAPDENFGFSWTLKRYSV